MKKLLTIACILTCALMLFACAAPETPANPVETIDVYVTISNAGVLQINQEKITVKDLNGDKKFNIDEVLSAAHAVKEKSADYASGKTEGYDGVSLLKLWGDTSGAFGYYVNDVSSWSLDDEVKAGDYITAYVYKDKDYYSDSFSYFNVRNLTVKKDEEFLLTLKNNSYDENWNTVVAPTVNAKIIVDGTESSIATDENGIAKVSFDQAGTYVLSATSETANLVPAVCVVTVK